jgi:hypothetical protein
MADIRHSIQIAAPAEKVFPLAATARGFTEWWAEDVQEVAGLVELGFFKRATIYRLRLTGENGPRKVDWICETGKEWAGTKIVFDLQTAGAGSVLNFAHTGWETETPYFVSCNTTWGALMFRLKAAAEGKKPGPLFLTDGMGY